ncbi:recombinase family protein [Alteraurantiacibacter buctensis]|uniref:Recombinase family protein n=1 Tax=Alteraurantiacibacter buctensis TaxID=1503981 RepID=A0A844Z2W8_9SPHN|nr:recombinase family protein [Alteraurantiacibacter buctensis]MXO73034.1 recombinase family protein [Alteraurantiacibacter buctensis]
MTTVRCAIYTRKSSEEGLEQDFNSLDAQREACAAYVLSQTGEGWKLLPDRYDDGGLSGGTLQRPALQRLLAEVKAGRIDIIVVYKVDRLTRSLLDFSKLVEALDAAGTSFVSVTQSFNTTTSMGRLTLNMLLSFAQFEREVTAERIRDKIAASKAKGMWMGGTPPLGYRPEGRSLAIVEEQARIVRDIYARYLELGNVRLLAEQLVAEGIGSPSRMSGKGQSFGGCPLTRGQLYYMLKNPIYAGDIPHKGKVYPGNHDPIIERAMWDRVQARLAANVQGQRTVRAETASLLAGLLVDADGEPLVPVHTRKGRQRYRYYVSRSLQHGTAATTGNGLRIPAREIEQVVRQEITSLLGDPLVLAQACGLAVTPEMLAPISQNCAETLPDLLRSNARLAGIVSRIVIHAGRVDIELAPAGLARILGIPVSPDVQQTIVHSTSVRLTRTGHVVRLVHDNGAPVLKQADPSLIRLILKARRWWGELAIGEVNIQTLADREKVVPSYVTRVVRLAFLAPQVIDAILTGSIRAGLNGVTVLRPNAIPSHWEQQVAKFIPGP